MGTVKYGEIGSDLLLGLNYLNIIHRFSLRQVGKIKAKTFRLKLCY